MTKDDIEAFFKSINFSTDDEDSFQIFWDFAKVVAAAEREACAKVCDDWQNNFEIDTRGWWASSLCAAAIRERDQA